MIVLLGNVFAPESNLLGGQNLKTINSENVIAKSVLPPI